MFTIEEEIEQAVAAQRRTGTGGSDLRARLEHLLKEGNLFQLYGTLCYRDSIGIIASAITGLPIEW